MPRYQIPNRVPGGCAVQPLEQFRRLEVFILQNLRAQLESGLQNCYIGELEVLDLRSFRPGSQPTIKEAKVSIRYLDRRTFLASVGVGSLFPTAALWPSAPALAANEWSIAMPGAAFGFDPLPAHAERFPVHPSTKSTTRLVGQ